MQGRFRSALIALSPWNVGTSSKNLVLWLRLRRDAAALDLWQKYFDAEEYLREHPDVARAKVDPWIHFLLRGNAECRNPSERFDIRRYLMESPDVKASGVNALLHFALFGNRKAACWIAAIQSKALPQPGPSTTIGDAITRWSAS